MTKASLGTWVVQLDVDMGGVMDWRVQDLTHLTQVVVGAVSAEKIIMIIIMDIYRAPSQESLGRLQYK